MINQKHFKDFPLLESKRLIFRKFSITDANDILKIRSDKKVMRYMDSAMHNTASESEKFITDNQDIYRKGKGLFWAIIDKHTGEFAGDFSFWNVDLKNARGQIGYTLKPKFWGKGFMAETLQQLLAFGFADLNLHSVEANINPENENSKRLLLKTGFQKEAYFRENYYFNGRFLDSEIYCLLQTDLKKTDQ